MSLGSLVLELQGNVARTQEDMGRLNQIVESAMTRIDTAARRTSANISGIASAAGSIRRIEGAKEAANDLDGVAHSAAGVRREWLVLTHELATGNFKRAMGSSLVLFERMDALKYIMSPLGLTIGAVAIAVGVFAIAAEKGAAQSAAFARSMALTSNFAGQTEGSFNAMAATVSAASNTSIGSARELSQELVSTGRFGAESIQHVAIAAAMLATASGRSAEEVVKEFERMSDGPTKFALEMDKSTHFLTTSLYEQIKALDEAGNKEAAMVVISDSVTAAYQRQGLAVKDAGVSWEGFKNWVSGAVDALEGFLGRNTTIEDRIAQIQNQLAAIPQSGSITGGVRNGPDPRIALQAALTDAVRQKMRQDDNALLQSQQDGHNARMVENQQFYDNLIKETRTREQERADAIKDFNARADQNNWSPTQRAEGINAINTKYKDRGQGGIDRANLDSVIQPLQEQITSEDKLLAFREQVLDQYYKANLISTQGYYDTRATVIEANSKRVQSLYDQEIAIYQNRAKSTTGATSIEARNKADQLQQEKQEALLRTGELLSDTTAQQTQAARQYSDQVEELQAQLDKLNHTQSESAGANFDRQHEQLRNRAAASNDTGTLNLINQVRDATVAQSQLNDLKDQGKQIEDQLAIAEKANALATQAGTQGEIQGEINLGNLRSTAAQQLRAISAQMQQIAAASGVADFKNQSGEFATQAQQLQQSSNVLGNTIEGTFQNQFSKVLDNAITRTKSLKKEFTDMATSIEDSISQIVSKDLATQLFGNIGGGGGGGQGGGGGGMIGSLVGMVLGFFGGASGSENLGASATSTPDDLISGFRATGGPTLAGGMYEVNERGPELLSVANRTFLMMGANDGKVTPMSGSASGSGGNTYHMNIAVPPGTSRATANQQASAIMRQAQVAQARNK